MPTEREEPVVFEVEGRKHVAWVAARKAKLLNKCLDDLNAEVARLRLDLNEKRAVIRLHRLEYANSRAAHAESLVKGGA